MSEILYRGFRTHILLPHDVVGTIIDDKPTWDGLWALPFGYGQIYYRDKVPVMQMKKSFPSAHKMHVQIKAMKEIWLQEPAISVKISRHPNGAWRGYGRGGKWVPTESGAWRWLDMKQEGKVPQAYRSTVHFTRDPTASNYTMGVEFRSDFLKRRFGSNGNFTQLLNRWQKRKTPPVPWLRCEVFDEGYELRGVCPKRNEKPRRGWELAGHEDFYWMHFHGWRGGAGAVTNYLGLTPLPGTDVTAADGFDKLWDPPSWCQLKPGQSISQTLTYKEMA